MDFQTLFANVFDPNSPYLLSDSFVHTFLRGMFLLGLGIYVLYAFVVVRQVRLMTRTIETGVDAPVKLLGWIHFFAAFGLFMMAFFTL